MLFTTSSVIFAAVTATTIEATQVIGHWIPQQDLTYDLGSTSSQWRSLYVGTSTIYLGGIPITVNTVSNTLVVGVNPGEEPTTATSMATESFVIEYVSQHGGGGSGVTGLTGDDSFTPTQEGHVKYELDINNDIQLTICFEGTGTFGPAIVLGDDINGSHGSGVVAIGNDDVGYDSKRGGVYIGHEAGWNNAEEPQGEFAIAIGAFAARNFAVDNSITLNATGEYFDPDEAGLFIKPIREEQYDDAVLFYNTSSGEVTYAANNFHNYTPADPADWEGTPTTVAAALNELAARISAIQNYEIDGGNAFTEPTGELNIDGGGA